MSWSVGSVGYKVMVIVESRLFFLFVFSDDIQEWMAEKNSREHIALSTCMSDCPCFRGGRKCS